VGFFVSEFVYAVCMPSSMNKVRAGAGRGQLSMQSLAHSIQKRLNDCSAVIEYSAGSTLQMHCHQDRWSGFADIKAAYCAFLWARYCMR
jgi:hypothetical protein